MDEPRRRELLTGNGAAAWGARLAAVDYIPAFPITPQTEIIETLATWADEGEIEGRLVTLESEHSMLTAGGAAAATGVRVFTATSSQGLLYAMEMIYTVAGWRVPLVLVNVSRGEVTPPEDLKRLLDKGVLGGVGMKRLFFAILGVFVMWTVCDYIIHSVLLRAEYEATADLWRPMSEIKNGLLVFVTLISAFVFVSIYERFFARRGVGTGVKYGLLFGLGGGIVGATHNGDHLRQFLLDDLCELRAQIAIPDIVGEADDMGRLFRLERRAQLLGELEDSSAHPVAELLFRIGRDAPDSCRHHVRGDRLLSVGKVAEPDSAGHRFMHSKTHLARRACANGQGYMEPFAAG